MRDPAVSTKLSDKIDEMFFTPEGIFFCYLLKTENVKRGMLNSMENAAAEIVPLLSDLIRSSEVGQKVIISLHLPQVDAYCHIRKIIANKFICDHLFAANQLSP